MHEGNVIRSSHEMTVCMCVCVRVRACQGGREREREGEAERETVRPDGVSIYVCLGSMHV